VQEEVAWLKLKERIVKSEKPIFAFSRTRYLQVAASVLIIVVASLLIYKAFPQKEIIASNNRVEIFYLPDGSQVWLNKNSSLTVVGNFEGSERKVQLIGEAYFQVAENREKPFVILAGNSITKVVGTSFDIKAFPNNDNVEINVRSGKVEFYNEKDHQELVLLGKNEKAILNNGSGHIVKLVEDFKADQWLQSAKKEPSIYVAEIESPKEYLTNVYSWKGNLVKQAVIEGEVVNGAVFTTYKNVRLKATYFTQNKDQVGIEYYVIPQEIKPGEVIEYKFKLDNWFKGATKVEMEIEEASPIE
jgi:hypothetical protein